MRRRLNLYRDYLGRRGIALLALGVLQVVTGWSILIAPPAVTSQLAVFRVFPQAVYGWAWVVPGTIALFFAFFRIGRDSMGFAASFSMPFLWGAAYLASWPAGDLDLWVAVRATTIYWSFATLVLVMAGWSEPVREVRDNGDH